ncbi:hypothetical protein NL676_034182 [Syzygium grande]|nr:hypothetical protein NL676_034182 [Syzygium grande]
MAARFLKRTPDLAAKVVAHIYGSSIADRYSAYRWTSARGQGLAAGTTERWTRRSAWTQRLAHPWLLATSSTALPQTVVATVGRWLKDGGSGSLAVEIAKPRQSGG